MLDIHHSVVIKYNRAENTPQIKKLKGDLTMEASFISRMILATKLLFTNMCHDAASWVSAKYHVADYFRGTYCSKFATFRQY